MKPLVEQVGVGTITGLDYWTHPNCKKHLVWCRTEAKPTQLLC